MAYFLHRLLHQATKQRQLINMTFGRLYKLQISLPDGEIFCWENQHGAAHGALQYGKEEGQRFHVIMYCPALSPSADSAKNYELRVRMGSCYTAWTRTRLSKRRCIFGGVGVGRPLLVKG